MHSGGWGYSVFATQALRCAQPLCCHSLGDLGGITVLSGPAPMAHVGRVVVAPPPGFVVEWQVALESPDARTEVWGVYDAPYQKVIEQLWTLGGTSMEYQPGATQKYLLDLNRLLQIRVSCERGWGSERRVRRIFVSDPAARSIHDAQCDLG